MKPLEGAKLHDLVRWYNDEQKKKAALKPDDGP